METKSPAVLRSVSFPRPAPRSDLNRLVCAAVVDRKFCQLLLSKPAEAIQAGYMGESFHLSEEENRRVLSIRAATLVEFSSQLLTAQTPAPVEMACVALD